MLGITGLLAVIAIYMLYRCITHVMSPKNNPEIRLPRIGAKKGSPWRT
jgi:hypothetical protein